MIKDFFEFNKELADNLEIANNERFCFVCGFSPDKFSNEIKKRIGVLRQYLNERKSKELITNKELEEWLLK